MRKEAWEKWATIINIIITVLIGIGFAFYLRIREENFQTTLSEEQQQFQRELVQFQADINKKIDFADLELSQPCIEPKDDCLSTIQIRNSGPANAKNVRILLAVTSTRSCTWSSAIGSVSNLKATVTPPIIDTSSRNRKLDLPESFGRAVRDGKCSLNLAEDNAIELTMPNLPVDQSARIKVSIADSMSLVTVSENITTTLEIINPKSGSAEQEANYVAWEYLQNQYDVALIEASLTCDNCRGSNGTYSFHLYNLLTWNYTTQVSQETANGFESEGTLQTSYLYFPSIVQRSGLGEERTWSLHLRATGSGNPNQPYTYEFIPSIQ